MFPFATELGFSVFFANWLCRIVPCSICGFSRSEIDLKRLRSSSLSKDESGTTIEARFTHFCKNDIRLDDNMLGQSTELFDESKNLLIANISALGNDTLDEAESVLVCICAILGEKV